MDTVLRCNELKCRALVPDQAVVTTCSHIYCIPCANRSGILDPENGRRVCPACNTLLMNPDDAVLTSLNPTEDYKTSILSGLSPNIIIEIAGRGLGFWAYQMAQEITYQEYLAKGLADRYTALNAQIDVGARKSREENNILRRRVDALQHEKQSYMNARQAAEDKYADKVKAFNRVNEMYRKLKAQFTAGGVEDAADQDAEQVVRQVANSQQQSQQAMSPRPTGKHVRPRGGSTGSGESEERRRRGNFTWQNEARQGYHDNDPSQGYQSRQASRAGVGTSRGFTMGTASSQRARLSDLTRNLPPPAFGHYNHTLNTGGAMNSASRLETPMGQYTSNNYGLSSQAIGARERSPRTYGPGLSGGMRQGRQPLANVPVSRGGTNTMRDSGYSGMVMR